MRITPGSRTCSASCDRRRICRTRRTEQHSGRLTAGDASLAHPPEAKEKGRRAKPRPFLLSDVRAGLRGLELFLGHDRAAVLALGCDVTVDELDDRDRSGVAGADPGLDDARVAAVAVGVTRGED